MVRTGQHRGRNEGNPTAFFTIVGTILERIEAHPVREREVKDAPRKISLTIRVLKS